MNRGMCMENGEDESEAQQRRAQDLIETVAPPRGKRPAGSARETSNAAGTAADEEHASEDETFELALQVSPDDIPTERPPWTDPVESHERVLPGVPIPPVKKNA